MRFLYVSTVMLHSYSLSLSAYTCTFMQMHTQIQPQNTAIKNYISLVPLEGNLDTGGGAGVLLLLLHNKDSITTHIIIFNHLHPSSLLLLALPPCP